MRSGVNRSAAGDPAAVSKFYCFTRTGSQFSGDQLQGTLSLLQYFHSSLLQLSSLLVLPELPMGDSKGLCE